MFENLSTSSDIVEDKDRLGAEVYDSDIYPCIVEKAYVTKAKSEATGIVIDFKNPDGLSHRETFWVASGKAKGCKNYYVNAKGEKHYLPGFNQVNALCKLTLDKEISQLAPEEKTINLWNSELNKEVPTEVPMLTELAGAEVYVGLLKIRSNKQKKDESTNKYVDTNEERLTNEVDKFFNTDKLTIQEVKADPNADPIFFDKWLNKWKGEMKDTYKATEDGVQSGSPSGGASKPATKSLFNNN